VERLGGVNAMEWCHDVDMAGWSVLVSHGGVCWCDATGVGVTCDLVRVVVTHELVWCLVWCVVCVVVSYLAAVGSGGDT